MKRSDAIGYWQISAGLLFVLTVVLMSGCPRVASLPEGEEGEGALVLQEGDGAVEAESSGTEGEEVEGEIILPPEGEGEQPGPEGAAEGVGDDEVVLPPEGEAELPGPEGAAEGTAEVEGVLPFEGEGYLPEPEGAGEGSLEEEGEALTEGEEPSPDALPLCEYWPLVTGNYWVDYPMTIIASSRRFQVDNTFARNGCEVFAVSWVSVNGDITQIESEFWVFLDGWLYVTEDPADLEVLPSVGTGMRRFLPEWLIPGEPFVSEYWPVWEIGEGVWTPTVDEAAIAEGLQLLGVAPGSQPVNDIVVLQYPVDLAGEVFNVPFALGRYYGPLALTGLGSIRQAKVLYSTECSGLGVEE
jgi:hypothetical protein